MSDTERTFDVLKKAMYESRIPMNGQAITGVTMFLVSLCGFAGVEKDSLVKAIDLLYKDLKETKYEN